jgi:hypothetical protein
MDNWNAKKPPRLNAVFSKTSPYYMIGQILNIGSGFTLQSR